MWNCGLNISEDPAILADQVGLPTSVTELQLIYTWHLYFAMLDYLYLKYHNNNNLNGIVSLQ